MDKTEELVNKTTTPLCVEHDMQIKINTKRIDNLELQVNGELGKPETGLPWIARDNRRMIQAIYKMGWVIVSWCLYNFGVVINKLLTFFLSNWMKSHV